MKKSKKNNYAIIVLIVLLIALAIGYAAFQTVLTVNGVATGTITWDVHFTNDTKFYEVVNGAKASTAITDTSRAEVTVNSQTTTGQAQAQTVDATVSLKYPGDAVILETVIVNSSSQPAKLTGFSIDGATNGLLVTQTTGATAITTGTVGGSTGDVLSANGGTCTAQFLVKWDESAAEFGDSNHEQEFQITFTYSQDTTNKTYTPTHSDS